MTPIDLTKKLKKYKSGWVALDKNHHIVAHAKTFSDIEKKVQGKKESVTLLPASDNYFGFITANG
ncbi:hypothetical protein HY029_04480 [Candidatus Gottesmanbacteria bacterium]|nr:hypothetical protein [Candidatus Gottesmanbacteria bacterium]